MITELKIWYPEDLSWEYNCLEVFLDLCGIFVYAEKDADFTKRQNPVAKELVELKMEKEQSIDEVFVSIKEILCLSEIESMYLEWLWNLYYKSDTSSNIYFALIMHKYREYDAGREVEQQSIQIIERLLEKIKNYQGIDCYCKFYGIAKLQYIVTEYEKEAENNIDSKMQELAQICQSLAMFKEAGNDSVAELMADIYLNLVGDYVLAFSKYLSCNLNYNYKVLRKMARYSEKIVIDPQKEMEYLQRTVQCHYQSYDARYRIGRKLECELLKFEDAIIYFEAIVNELDDGKNELWLMPEEYLTLCRALKRFGCILYKYLEKPDYRRGIEAYERIYKLREMCEKNRFICKFNGEQRDQLIKLYRDMYPIEHVKRSENNIRQKMAELQQDSEN